MLGRRSGRDFIGRFQLCHLNNRAISSRSFSSHVRAAGISSTFFRRGIAFALISAAGLTLALKSRNPVLLDAAPLQSETRVDPDTGIEFPETLVIPSRVRLPPLTLVGAGVRRVSFLGIKVYSVGFYADLSNPALKIPENASPEEKIEYIISNTPCALRIVPTRSTSYTHLRDSFIRSLQARMSSQLKDKSLKPEEAEDTQSPLRKLKSMFPNTPLSKGSPLDILLLPPSKSTGDKQTLIVRDLGSLENDWVAKNFFMAYFAGDGISPPMKKSVVDFLQNKPPITN